MSRLCSSKWMDTNERKITSPNTCRICLTYTNSVLTRCRVLNHENDGQEKKPLAPTSLPPLWSPEVFHFDSVVEDDHHSEAGASPQPLRSAWLKKFGPGRDPKVRKCVTNFPKPQVISGFLDVEFLLQPPGSKSGERVALPPKPHKTGWCVTHEGHSKPTQARWLAFFHLRGYTSCKQWLLACKWASSYLGLYLRESILADEFKPIVERMSR